jgi:hypothetical protein
VEWDLGLSSDLLIGRSFIPSEESKSLHRARLEASRFTEEWALSNYESFPPGQPFAWFAWVANYRNFRAARPKPTGGNREFDQTREVLFVWRPVISRLRVISSNPPPLRESFSRITARLLDTSASIVRIERPRMDRSLNE